MSSESSSNGSTSGKTSTNAPGKPGTESEYLAREAKEAQKAMQEAMKELASAVAQGADPRAWLQQRPWITMGSVAAAGFLAAYGLIPSQEQAALKRIEALEEAVARGRRRAEEEDPAPNGKPGKQKKNAGAWVLRTVARQSFNLVKPALIAAVTANLKQDKDDKKKPEEEPAARD